MQQLLNIRFSFLCRTTRSNADGKNLIVFRISFRSERRDIFTDLIINDDLIPPNYFNPPIFFTRLDNR